MEGDKAKWDERYNREGYFLGPTPSRFLTEHIGFIKTLCPGRTALDIACGEGRNSVFLAHHGFKVTGLDISEAGIDKACKWMESEGLRIDFRVADLERYEFTGTYDLIINFNFLLRDLIPKEVQALNPGGVLVFDTILDAPTLQGVHNREFLLQPGELKALFERFDGKLLHYQENPLDATPTAKLIFQKS